MARPRAPWWMFLVAASFLAFVALIVYETFCAPSGPDGLEFDWGREGMVVLGVEPNSFADRAGLMPHDRVIAVDGQVIRNTHDWEAIRANTEIGRPERWEIARGDQRLQRMLTFQREPLIGWQVPEDVDALGYLVVVLTSFILSLVIAFSRPNDSVARMGAWLVGTASIAFGVPDGWAATWRHLPALIGVLLWIPQISRFVADAVLFTFFTIFPKRLFQARWPWMLLWGPALLPLPWRISATYAVIYQPSHSTGAPEWIFQAAALRTVLYLAAGVAALVVNYRRLEDINQRRRVRVLMAGVGLGLSAAIATIVIESLGHWTKLTGALYAAATVVLLTFPLSFAYAILRHRLFDIRVMIRQGLQYALARGLLLSLVPALGAILLLDLVLHSEQTLAQILVARGWIYAALAGLAWAAHTKREPWLQALDRRFFRERYDAQRILKEVVEEVRSAGSFEKVAPRVVAKIEAGLHPEFTALLAREPGQASYDSLAAAPAGQAPPPLRADSRLVALVRALGQPVEVSLSESGWLKERLPHEETDFLRKARIDLLVPVAMAPERAESLLALGPKRSEEPYTREDQELLVTIAANLALVLEKPAAVPQQVGGVSEAFEECPQCGACYDTGAVHCAQEGATLVRMRLLRTLVGRYRLEKRRGRGGMGAVYEAVDTALERRVAVKVIRDDLIGSAEAAERFRKEARAAASFTHPHVVTVHDFGVAADARAFLVMELLEGATLRDELKQNSRLPPSRALEIMQGVSAAVEAAHHRQLIHRDLKPENVFLARSENGETAKVLDFGIAKFLPSATQATADTGTGVLAGTMLYMSPEQLRGEKVAAAWDLWALALMAYEMLTGVHAFASATSGEWQSAVLGGRFAPLSKYLPDASGRLQEFFERVLAVDPARRPNSARIFFSELERALT